MKLSLGISNFLEEISSLSNSIIFLYFLALITEEGFLVSPCYSLELCIQMLKILQVMLKILQARLQQYVNRELPDVQAGFREGRGTRDKIANIHWVIEKVHLKFNIQETKIMAPAPITSWQIDGETMETVRDFIFWGSKITADGDCSHEIKRHLLLGRKSMSNLDSILKSRNITLPTKVHLVKAMVFLVVMYGCESCTVKKAEC